MSKDTGTGSGLLSKVVKFVTSPTTHWADLDRPISDEGNTESRLALKEMIERKRRNDFVRNRELDMLRKLRRRERVPGEEAAAAAASFYPSSQPPRTGERARTLEKIDQIEAQMATSWFKRKNTDGVAPVAPIDAQPHPQTGGAPQAAPHHAPRTADTALASATPAPGDTAYARTTPTPLSERAPVRPLERPPVRELPPLAFGTTTLPGAESAQASRAAPAAPAPVPLEQPFTVTQPMVAFGGAEDFNVEVLIEARQDPEIEEAAIRFANGDTAGAEAGLRALLAEGGPRADDVDTWLTLFDLYRASGQQTRFDDAALDFAARFGRSPPQWALVTERASAPAPMLPTATTTGLFHWVCPSSVGTQSVATLKATLGRQAPPWRIDWRHLKAIDPAALPALIEALQHLANTAVRVKFLGAETLLALLTEQSPTDDRETDPQWWEARLAVLRVMGDIDEFEVVALNYCVTYEVSPPAWEDPQSRYTPMNEEGKTLQPSAFGDDARDPADPVSFSATDVRHAAGQPHDDGVAKGELAGELVGSAEDALRKLHGSVSTLVYEINCRQLLRADFGAAGDLLNWAMATQAQGKSITFKQVNRLVAAFFGVVGINGVARILLRVD
ncbi:MAG: hypothetical protein Q4G71_12305 [Pseudomonadota bacterium]|nr:hypothetical protein [Pseudomonadota bacterium]